MSETTRTNHGTPIPVPQPEWANDGGDVFGGAFVGEGPSPETEQERALRRALAQARKTIRRLNRRVQSAESGLAAKLKQGGPSFGRALANAAATMYKAQAEEATAALEEIALIVQGAGDGPLPDRVARVLDISRRLGEHAAAAIAAPVIDIARQQPHTALLAAIREYNTVLSALRSGGGDA